MRRGEEKGKRPASSRQSQRLPASHCSVSAWRSLKRAENFSQESQEQEDDDNDLPYEPRSDDDASYMAEDSNDALEPEAKRPKVAQGPIPSLQPSQLASSISAGHGSIARAAAAATAAARKSNPAADATAARKLKGAANAFAAAARSVPSGGAGAAAVAAHPAPPGGAGVAAAAARYVPPGAASASAAAAHYVPPGAASASAAAAHRAPINGVGALAPVARYVPPGAAHASAAAAHPAPVHGVGASAAAVCPAPANGVGVSAAGTHPILFNGVGTSGVVARPAHANELGTSGVLARPAPANGTGASSAAAAQPFPSHGSGISGAAPVSVRQSSHSGAMATEPAGGRLSASVARPKEAEQTGQHRPGAQEHGVQPGSALATSAASSPAPAPSRNEGLLRPSAVSPLDLATSTHLNIMERLWTTLGMTEQSFMDVTPSNALRQAAFFQLQKHMSPDGQHTRAAITNQFNASNREFMANFHPLVVSFPFDVFQVRETLPLCLVALGYCCFHGWPFASPVALLFFHFGVISILASCRTIFPARFRFLRWDNSGGRAATRVRRT